MPVLKNPRHEHFAQLLKRGVTAYQAYPMAGFRPHRANCYRLSENESIKARTAELTRHIAVKTRVTIETLTEQFIEDREFARTHDNPSAAHAASVSIGKLHGLMIDRKESGQPGEFDGLKTREEVRAQIAHDMGEEAAKLFDAALGDETRH